MNSDQIHIKGLRLRAIIGIYDYERISKQDIVVNITLYTNHTVADSDNITDTVDYQKLTEQIIKMVEKSNFLLIEKMALEITKLCLIDKRIKRAIINVEKPGALKLARSAGVTIDRYTGENDG